jgi:hypothetical protein
MATVIFRIKFSFDTQWEGEGYQRRAGLQSQIATLA